MRILLDENVDVELQQAFSEPSQAETVTYRGWNGLSNGELLQRAQVEYDVLITMETNLRHQQNLRLFDSLLSYFDLRAMISKISKPLCPR